MDGISKCSQSWGFQPHKKDTMNASFKPSVLAGLLIMLGGCASVTQAPVPAGVVKGSLTQHTEQSAKEVMDTAQLV